MTKEQKRIYLDLWMSFHPYKKPSQSDYYYLDLCNRIRKIIDSPDHEEFISLLTEEQKEDFCCFLVCYLEDIISETGMWQAFTSMHFELYGKFLPFFNPEEYYQDEINPEDVLFLVWYYISTALYNETVFLPVSNELSVLGNEIFELLDSAYEHAPENTRLREFLEISPGEEDFFRIREKIEYIIMNSYLFHFNMRDYFIEIADKINEEGEDFVRNRLPAYMYELKNSYAISGIYPLLALRGKDWLAQILGREHPLFKDIMAISDYKTGLYLFMKSENGYLYFQHVASGTILPVTIKSFREIPDLKEEKDVIAGSFVEWKNEWWFSGMLAIIPYESDLVVKEKNSTVSRTLFGGPLEKQREAVRLQSEAFLKFNKGKPISFFNSGNEAARFVLDFLKFQRASSPFSFKSADKAFRKSGKKELPDLPDELPIDDKAEKVSAFVFFNPESGIEMAYGYNELIPDPDNPLYDEEECRENFIELIATPDISRECSLYLMETYKILGMGFPEEKNKNIIEENLDFLLRYWKRDKYYSRPEVTFV